MEETYDTSDMETGAAAIDARREDADIIAQMAELGLPATFKASDHKSKKQKRKSKRKSSTLPNMQLTPPAASCTCHSFVIVNSYSVSVSPQWQIEAGQSLGHSEEELIAPTQAGLEMKLEATSRHEIENGGLEIKSLVVGMGDDELKSFSSAYGCIQHATAGDGERQAPWQAVWDEDYCQWFFYNSTTQESQWEVPPGFDWEATSGQNSNCDEFHTQVHLAKDASPPADDILDHGSQKTEAPVFPEQLGGGTSPSRIKTDNMLPPNSAKVCTMEQVKSSIRLKTAASEPADDMFKECEANAVEECVLDTSSQISANGQTSDKELAEGPSCYTAIEERVDSNEEKTLKAAEGHRMIGMEETVMDAWALKLSSNGAVCGVLGSGEEDLAATSSLFNGVAHTGWPSNKSLSDATEDNQVDGAALLEDSAAEGREVAAGSLELLKGKYWHQRYALFSLFDEGIVMDDEGWYSVTPEAIAKHQAKRCAAPLLVDAFTGCGGNAIQFALTCHHVLAIDIDPRKIEMARRNAAIYGVEDKIDFIVGDFLQLAPKMKADVVFLSPPWGGPQYSKVTVYDLQTMLKPCSGFDLFNIACKVAPSIVFFVPRNVDVEQLQQMASLSSPPLTYQVENNLLDGKLKTVTAYYGPVAASPCQHACCVESLATSATRPP